MAIYRELLRALLSQTPLRIGGAVLGPDNVEAVVARIDETTNESQAILDLPPFDLEMESADVGRLLAPDGQLARILHTQQLENLNYQLDAKCDGCVFDVHCLPESARLRRHELLGVSPATARALREAGVPNVDALAELDLGGTVAARLRSDQAFDEHLPQLVEIARARRRTLPGGDDDEDTFEVMALPHSPQSLLPEHERNAQRLVRVYLAVDYDYTENRVGALTAHITNSDAQLHTGWIEGPDGKRRPDPVVKERKKLDGQRNPEGRQAYEVRPLSGATIVQVVSSEWTGRYEEDTGAERLLLENFIRELIDAVAQVADAEEASIHFYVWSPSEMTQLVEACSRASSRLLGALRELLGCRESLEQLIYSSLQQEVDRRYALGWTGRGLVVATSLRWFGHRYHWVRRVGGKDVSLDQDLEQDIFDFKTDLDINPDGSWARSGQGRKHKFEIRSRFHDSLTAPYWRAYWQTLPDPSTEKKADVAKAIDRYNRISQPQRLRTYLTARVHALRWIEERCTFKNREIEKPPVAIDEIQRFSLGVDDASAAAIDFLRLDHWVRGAQWLSDHMIPPAARVPTGRTLPLADVMSDGKKLTARIDCTGFDVDLPTLAVRSRYREDDFVRVAPCASDPDRGQTPRQLLTGIASTCVIKRIDWSTGEIELEPFPSSGGGDRYIVPSGIAGPPGVRFATATLDESITDFVAGRVEARLTSSVGRHVVGWFDPAQPAVPAAPAIPEAQRMDDEELLSRLALPRGSLATDQRTAILDGLGATVQLLQGPPGTGKTMTTAVAILTRIQRQLPATGAIVLVAATTHTAVDNLLERIQGVIPDFTRHARSARRSMPIVHVAKVVTKRPESPSGNGIEEILATSSARKINQYTKGGILVLGGTTAALLKLSTELVKRRPWKDRGDGFQTRLLIVDEASMMVFPHFLALASLVEPQGKILLAGDHRQLSPILAHDWEREDRPPTVIYQPFTSAYEAVRRIASNPGIGPRSVRQSALSYTFRLPPLIVDLISRLYRLDQIELEGIARALPDPSAAPMATGADLSDPLAAAWAGDSGLFLVLHDEHASRQANEVEGEIIESILAKAPPMSPGSIAVITPHRAQRALLTSRLSQHTVPAGPVDVIDTVERVQGGERRVVLVSGTASDPSAIASTAEFLLDLNRSNVAFSRAQDRLIVVCSRSLLDHVPADLEHYQGAMLWKSLRALCSEVVATGEMANHRVQVLTVPMDSVDEPKSPMADHQ
nr:AAA domain-containing protein [Microbispora hainanensis]